MREQRIINNFYVFYRISDNGYKNKIKLEYATKINCLKNTIEAFSNSKIIVFIDGVVESTDKAIHDLCDNLGNVEIKYLQCRSNPKSFRYVYEEALKLNDNDFVYFLEDDYLHLSNSYSLLREAAERNYTDYITLYDHPDKYEEGCVDINPFCKEFGEKTVVFRTQNHHWKLTNSTTMTFGAFVNVLKRDKDVFWKNTDKTTSNDFKIFIELSKKGALVSSPIPSLSTHCEKNYLAPFVNWKKCVKMDKTCCIAFITHKYRLEGTDEKAFKKCIDVFGKKRDIKIILPDNVSTNYYDEFNSNSIFEYIKVDHSWLDNLKSYNKMCCSKEFYKNFRDYDYMLIYQCDCWVFEDKLDEFMKLGYDWYGAAWPHASNKVGNGGLSLRNVSKMLEITTKHEFNFDSIEGAEDTWFCQKYGNEMNICDLDTACNFSIEAVNKSYFNKVKTIPMGFHGKAMRERCWDDDGSKFLKLKNKI